MQAVRQCSVCAGRVAGGHLRRQTDIAALQKSMLRKGACIRFQRCVTLCTVYQPMSCHIWVMPVKAMQLSVCHNQSGQKELLILYFMSSLNSKQCKTWSFLFFIVLTCHTFCPYFSTAVLRVSFSAAECQESRSLQTGQMLQTWEGLEVGRVISPLHRWVRFCSWRTCNTKHALAQCAAMFLMS